MAGATSACADIPRYYRYESGTTVSPDYTAHTSRFNGKVAWVQIDLGEDAKDADHYVDHDERVRVMMARQ